MKGQTMVVLALSLILALSSQGQGGIVAFGGQYEDHHTVNLNDTNRLKIVFSNIIYRDNSTLQFKIMATPGNALYIDSEGKQNDSWGIFITISQGNKVLISHSLTNRFSLATRTENGQRYRIEIDITIPRNIRHGNYTLIFMALSSVYCTKSQADDATQGLNVGASIQESLAIKHYLEVGRWPIEREKTHDNSLIIIGLFIFGIITITALSRIVIWELKRLRKDEI